MNTHRRLIVLILAVLLLFTLACTVVGVQTSTQVYEDERSETTMLIVMDKEFLSLDPSMEDLWNEQLANIRNYLEQQGATVSDYEDSKVRGIKAVETFNTLDELRSSVSASGTTVFNSFEMKRWRGEYLFDARTTSERIKQRITEITGLTEDDLFMLVAPLIVKLKFPGEMTSNADEVESSGAHVWYIEWWVSGADHRLSATSRVSLREPVILSPESGTALDPGNKTVSFSGTGEPGSDIVLYRIDGSNRVSMGESVVSAEGTWQFSNITFSGGQANPSSDETYTVEVEERVDEETKTSMQTTLIVKTLPEISISGRVTNGKGFPLVDVQVQLSSKSEDGTRTPQTGFVSTDQDGRYELQARVAEGEYQVEVWLEDMNGRKQIIFNPTAMGVQVWAPVYIDPNDKTEYEQDIDFGNLAKVETSLPAQYQTYLDDLATTYYYIWSVQDFVHNDLKSPEYEPVKKVLTWTLPDDTAFYPVTKSIRLDSNYSKGVSNKRIDSIRHETFHHVMGEFINEAMIQGPNYGENHGGSSNPSTQDSWLEGWAEFWPCVMRDNHVFGTVNINIEHNWKVWDKSGTVQREEYAVAGLLWDLTDPRRKIMGIIDEDNIEVNTKELWDVIITSPTPVVTIYDLYHTLLSAITSGSLKNKTGAPTISKNDLDQIFISHGFYAERGNKPMIGSYKRDPEEEVGWGGRVARRSTVLVDGAYVKVNLVDKNNNPISEGTVDVFVDFEEDYYDYTYSVDVSEASSLIYVELPPTRTHTLAHITARNATSTQQMHYSIDSVSYWQKVAETTTGYADEVTIEVKKPASVIDGESWWKNPWLTYGLGGMCGVILLVVGGIAVVVVLNNRGSGKGGRGGRARTTKRTPTRRPTPTRRSPPTRRTRP